MKVFVIGASRGIGLEFVTQHLKAGDTVTATARRAVDVGTLQQLGAQAFALDVTSAVSVAGVAWRIDAAGFDRVIVNAGVYGPRHAALEAPTDAEFDQVMHTNVLGAMRLLGELSAPGVLAPGATLAVLSSRMGSIGERRSPSGWLYRASKAALNSALRDASLVLGSRAICVALHPGWVRTDMGGSYADLTPTQSVTDLRHTLDRLTAESNGCFLNHDGSPIDW
jgi:NAD(P)-dependent dehydrogenase (short-subunit alcohol dehydrogenase family)